MMGCQPQSSSHRSATHADPRYSLASHTHLQETVSLSQPLDSHQAFFVQTSPLAPPPTAQQTGCEDTDRHRAGRTDTDRHRVSRTETAPHPGSYSTTPTDFPGTQHSSPHADSVVQQHPAFPAETVTSHHHHHHHHHPTVSGSQSVPWTPSRAAPHFKLSQPPGQQRFAQSSHTVTSQPTQPFAQPVKTVVTQYETSGDPQHHIRSEQTSHKSASSQPQQPSSLEKTEISQQCFAELSEQQQYSRSSSSVSSLHPPPASFTGRSTDSGSSVPTNSAEPYSHQAVSAPQDSVQQKASSVQQHRQPETLSPHLRQHSPTGYTSTMLDKKPTLQVVTTDHSPISPGSTASSPRFIFPDMQASSSSGHLGSDSGSSPFMSPVKQEVKLETGTPPHSSELESSLYQAQRERRRMLSGDTELSETLVDSETGSSLLEDSSSSREQSPFSAMAESLSLRSPSEHSPSPLTRKTFQHQIFLKASEEEEQGEGEEGGGPATSQPDTEFHPSKFKRRLHERYVLSLKDAPQGSRRVKEECAERYESSETESHSDSKRPLSKVERSDSPQHTDSPMPKSPRRSSSDTDMLQTESGEMGASSADEGDVFMEPTMRVRTKHKPPSLHHQREPLDLSRGPFYSGFRSSSGSSPLIDPEHLSPSSKIYSPVFRPPHRIPYSPHGLMSPQSQSPLCSVPEGGRIFNFNMPSPLEGPHSDSDLISPSPMSPRIFTFPPQGSILNPMSEVNRLAVSPRAPYTPPPSFMRSKPLGGGGMVDPKWGDQQGFYSKRSLSESDMTYLCPVCGQVFPTNDNLAKHMTKHMPSETVRASDNNKVHYCKVCNRCFSRSDMLTRHMRLHTGLKPYECMECGQVFSRSDHLNTHRRTHTGEKPYRCPHCPYAACRRDMITRHMRTHAKRTSRRARYLSVPDDGDAHKPSGSISSTDTLDSQEYSTGVHTCSVSSVDSVESESLHSPHPTYLGASVDSLLSPGPHSSPSSRKPSEELEEGMEGGTNYDRFMHYRKARNWSTTSLESVDSEEAILIREVLVDDAFQDPEPRPPPASGVEGGSKEGVGHVGQGISCSSKDMGGLDAKTLQKCFISSQPPGSSSS